MICAVLSGNAITNTIVVGDEPGDLESCADALGVVLVEIPEGVNAGIGWTYDLETAEFIAPVVEDVPAE